MPQAATGAERGRRARASGGGADGKKVPSENLLIIKNRHGFLRSVNSVKKSAAWALRKLLFFRADDAHADKVVAGSGAAAVSEIRRAVGCFGIPCAAASHAVGVVGCAFGAARVYEFAGRIAVVPIPAPFPYVSEKIVKAEHGRRF